MALDRRKLRYGGNATAAVLAFVGLFFLTNVIAERRFKRFDWTGSKIYSLSDKTIKTLQGLKSDVEVTVLIQPAHELYDEVRETLNNYRAKSPHLKVEFLDPGKEPARVDQILKTFGIDPRGDSTAVVFSSGERHKHVPVTDLVEYDMSQASMGEAPSIKAFKGELAFTSAILSVTQTHQTSIYFLKGHDEASLDDPQGHGLAGFAEALKRENFKVDSTDVLGRAPLPTDCDLLVIAGPQRALVDPEAEALGKAIDSGVRVLALIDPVFSRDRQIQPSGLETVFSSRGVTLDADIALDPSRTFLGTAESFTVADFPSHPITHDLGESFLLFRLARSTTPETASSSGWTISPLARTSDKGWGERDLAKLPAISNDPTDLKGPVVLAAVAEKKGEGGKTLRFVVVGDSDPATNQFIGGAANLDFFLNTVHWLTGSEEQIGIAAREPEQVHLTMTGSQKNMVRILSLLAMPGLAILAGLGVWLTRRR